MKDTQARLIFVWTATMQNHAPYDDLSSVPSEITFEDYNNPAAQEYLNLIYQSDKALGRAYKLFPTQAGRGHNRNVRRPLSAYHKLHGISLWQGCGFTFNGGLLKTSTDAFPYLEQQGALKRRR